MIKVIQHLQSDGKRIPNKDRWIYLFKKGRLSGSFMCDRCKSFADDCTKLINLFEPDINFILCKSCLIELEYHSYIRLFKNKEQLERFKEWMIKKKKKPA